MIDGDAVDREDWLNYAKEMEAACLLVEGVYVGEYDPEGFPLELITWEEED